LLDIYRQQKDSARLLDTLGEAVGRAGNLNPLGAAAKAVEADDELSKSIVEQALTGWQAEPAKMSYVKLLAAGLIAVVCKDFDAAEKLFPACSKAEGGKPAETLITWGLELFLANQYERAANVFEQGLADKVLPADNPSLHFYLAGALEMSGHTDAA